MIAFILMGLLGTTVIGMALLDMFDGESDPAEGGSGAEEEMPAGKDLFFDGSETLFGTDGHDTLGADQDQDLSPDVIELGGGDDTATLAPSYLYDRGVFGGDGDDTLIDNGFFATLHGGAGDDFLSGVSSDILHGDAGNDVLVYDRHAALLDANSGMFGGTGDDILTVKADAGRAWTSDDYYGVNVNGGAGHDTFNVVLELQNAASLEDEMWVNRGDEMDTRACRISDFDPSEDTIVVEIDRTTGTEDRDVTVDMVQNKTPDGQYASIVTLTFAQTDAAIEASSAIYIKSDVPITLDDIKFINL
jgi:hypothetical protein